MSDEIETIDRNPKSWAAWKREAERLQKIIDGMALAAMDSEHHTDDELSNLLWYSQEATCHSDPNYYCEFQRLATPGLIAGIIRELQERRKAAMDSEPVIVVGDDGWDALSYRRLIQSFEPGTKLYRHAQPAPVVPEEATPDSIEILASARRRDHAVFQWNEDQRNAAADSWNACRAAMLEAAPQEER